MSLFIVFLFHKFRLVNLPLEIVSNELFVLHCFFLFCDRHARSFVICFYSSCILMQLNFNWLVLYRHLLKLCSVSGHVYISHVIWVVTVWYSFSFLFLSQHDQIISGIDWSIRSNRIVTVSHDRNSWVPAYLGMLKKFSCGFESYICKVDAKYKLLHILCLSLSLSQVCVAVPFYPPK